MKTVKKSFFSLLSVGTLMLAGCGGSGGGDLYQMNKINEGKVIATVNGTEIHEGFLNVLSEFNPRIKAQLANPLTKSKIINTIIEQELLYQEAVKQGVDKDPVIFIKSELNRHMIVSNTLLEKEMEKAMKQQYEEKKDSQFTKLSISQIFISATPLTDGKIDPKAPEPTPEQKAQALARAKTIKDRLSKGEDFAKVAQEVSDDSVTKTKGGKAGMISKNDKRYARLGLSSLAEAAFKLKKGDVSDPIDTPKGYYIIQVTSDPEITSFDDAKRVLGFEMQSTVKSKLIDDLKKQAKVEFATNPEKPKPEPLKLETPATDNSQPAGTPNTPASANTPEQHP